MPKALIHTLTSNRVEEYTYQSSEKYTPNLQKDTGKKARWSMLFFFFFFPLTPLHSEPCSTLTVEQRSSIHFPFPHCAGERQCEQDTDTYDFCCISSLSPKVSLYSCSREEEKDIGYYTSLQLEREKKCQRRKKTALLNENISGDIILPMVAKQVTRQGAEDINWCYNSNTPCTKHAITFLFYRVIDCFAGRGAPHSQLQLIWWS